MIYLNEIRGTIESFSPIQAPKKSGGKFMQRFVLHQFGNVDQSTGYRYPDQYYEAKIYRRSEADLKALPIKKGTVVSCSLSLYGNQFTTDRGLSYGLNLIANKIEAV